MPTLVQTDIKANTEIAIFQIIQPAVEDYLTTTRGKTWKMVKAAQEARKLVGDGPEPEKTVREQFKKAFLERKASPSKNLTEDDEYNNNAKLVAKVVKVAFHYTEEQIEKLQKKQSFFQLFNKIKSVSVDEQPTQQKTAEVTDNKEPEEEPTDTPAPDKNLGALMAPKSTGWSKTDQPRMKEFDEWHNETLAIISDQFEKRFLPTIKKAMEVELTALKKKQLISTLNHS
jgi:hypothetical protein